MTYNIVQIHYIIGHKGDGMILEVLLGSVNKERVLQYILAFEEGYAREIARFYETDLTPIQKQLEKLELGGVLISREAGRTRLYSFNPRYAFLGAMKELLEQARGYYPPEDIDRLTMVRKRPRRSEKKL